MSRYRNSMYLEFQQRGLNVQDYGAKGDGVTDDTAAFNSALNAAKSNSGGVVIVPPTKSGYLIAGQITVPTGVSLIGSVSFPAQPQVNNAPITNAGSAAKLFVTNTSSSAIYLNGYGSVLKGFVFYYPNQTDTNPPVTYPASIEVGTGLDLWIEDILFVNAYDGINASQKHGRLHMRNIYGYCLYRMFFIDGAIDVDTIENVECINAWPSNVSSTSPSLQWSQANGVNMYIGCTSPGLQVKNVTLGGGKYAVELFSGTVSGASGPGYSQWENVCIDTVSNTGIVINDYNLNGLQFNNLQIAAAPVAINIQANEPNGTAHFTNTDMWNVDTALTINGSAATQIDFNSLNVNWTCKASNQVIALAQSGYVKLTINTGKFIKYPSAAGTNFTDIAFNMTTSGSADVQLNDVSYTNGNITTFVSGSPVQQYRILEHGAGKGTAAPAVGTWQAGNVVWNTGAAGTGHGWRCNTAGNPGTWESL